MKYFKPIFILLFVLLLSGCASQDTSTTNKSTTDTADKSFDVKFVSEDDISGYSVKGCTDEERQNIDKQVGNSIKAFNEITSIDISTSIMSENTTPDSSERLSSNGSTQAVFDGTNDKFTQYTEMTTEIETSEPASQINTVTVQTYAVIEEGNKAEGYRKVSHNDSESDWIKEDRTYNDTYDFSALLERISGVDNSNISMESTTDFNFISFNISLYDYFSYQPVQLNYSEDFTTLLENSQDTVPVTIAIDLSNNLIAGIYVHDVNYSYLDFVTETETGNIYSTYNSYNTLTEINKPDGIES